MATARIFNVTEKQLEHRNMHCLNSETDKWITVLHNGYHNALMQISKVTTGRFTCVQTLHRLKMRLTQWHLHW